MFFGFPIYEYWTIYVDGSMCVGLLSVYYRKITKWIILMPLLYAVFVELMF